MYILYNWYFLPNQGLINGDLKMSDTLYVFKQEKVVNITKNDRRYIINDKFIIYKNNIDSFSKNLTD